MRELLTLNYKLFETHNHICIQSLLTLRAPIWRKNTRHDSLISGGIDVTIIYRKGWKYLAYFLTKSIHGISYTYESVSVWEETLRKFLARAAFSCCFHRSWLWWSICWNRRFSARTDEEIDGTKLCIAPFPTPHAAVASNWKCFHRRIEGAKVPLSQKPRKIEWIWRGNTSRSDTRIERQVNKIPL